MWIKKACGLGAGPVLGRSLPETARHNNFPHGRSAAAGPRTPGERAASPCVRRRWRVGGGEQRREEVGGGGDGQNDDDGDCVAAEH